MVRLLALRHNCRLDHIDRLDAARGAGTSPSYRQLHTGMRAATPTHHKDGT